MEKMKFTHKVQKWENGYFTEKTSESTTYFSMGAHLEGDDDVDDVAVETLRELYLLWQDAKRGDKACREKGWKYSFYKHRIETERWPNGTEVFVDNVIEGKVSRRGNKVYFKAIG